MEYVIGAAVAVVLLVLLWVAEESSKIERTNRRK